MSSNASKNKISFDEAAAGLQGELEKQAAAAKGKELIYQGIADQISKKVPPSELESLIGWMTKYKESFEQKIAFREVFDAFPQDGAVALQNALQDKFGFVESKSTRDFWGDERPPATIGVKVGPNKTVQAPWGEFALPGHAGLVVGTSAHAGKDGFRFQLYGQCKRKDEAVVKDLIERVRDNLKNRSIYRGKAISLAFPEDFNPEEYTPDDVEPEFLDLTRINQDELILSDTVLRMVQDNIFTPVEKTELCRKFGVPLRRGVLLAGTYGVGKTLTAQIGALKATRNGWTFIYLKNVRNISEGLRVARQYAPAMVFAEDIDHVTAGDNRTDSLNAILNTVDGIELKGKDVILVLTSNHVERINPAMIRPGRIDALIEMTPPDAKAAERLLKVYGKGLISQDADLSDVGIILSGQRPAMIAETVQRSKLSAITRMAINEEELNLLPEDLEAAAKGMRHHISLVDGGETRKQKTPAEAIGENVLNAFQHARTTANGHTTEA